jgi:hypothetical protein
MRSMRFFHPMVRPRELSRVNLRTLCAHRACLTYGLRFEHAQIPFAFTGPI